MRAALALFDIVCSPDGMSRPAVLAKRRECLFRPLSLFEVRNAFR